MHQNEVLAQPSTIRRMRSEQLPTIVSFSQSCCFHGILLTLLRSAFKKDRGTVRIMQNQVPLRLQD